MAMTIPQGHDLFSIGELKPFCLYISRQDYNDLSFSNTVEKGLVKNIPGARMCACIGEMPIVS